MKIVGSTIYAGVQPPVSRRSVHPAARFGEAPSHDDSLQNNSKQEPDTPMAGATKRRGRTVATAALAALLALGSLLTSAAPAVASTYNTTSTTLLPGQASETSQATDDGSPAPPSAANPPAVSEDEDISDSGTGDTSSIAGLPAAGPSAATDNDPSREKPFNSSSIWKRGVPDNPAIDSNSQAIVAAVTQQAPVLDIQEFGVPVYYAESGTPRRTIQIEAPWGVNKTMKNVPVPEGARPAPGSDGAMVVIDTTPDATGKPANKIYEFWIFDGKNKAAWGDVSDLAADGSHNNDGSTSMATGAGISRAAGLIRPEELAAGHIDHALFVSSSSAAKEFRFPATKSDGHSTPTPEGTWLQLDPSLDLDKLGLSREELIVGKALQHFGAIVGDVGGASMAIICTPGPGMPDDYTNLPKLHQLMKTHLRALDPNVANGA